MRFQRHHSALIVASLVTVASFVGATAYTQSRLARLDALSSTIETNAVPSIERLSRAAVRLTRLSQLMDDVATADRHPGPAIAAARQEVAALDRDVAGYLSLKPLRGESAFWTALRADVARAIGLVRARLDAEQGNGRVGPGAPPPDAVDDALDQAVRSVLATLDFDVRESESMARDVRDVRVTTLRMIVALDALSTAIATFAVLVAYRASRRHDALLHAHTSLLTTRVSELDTFAGRVAHDVLSPLGTIATALPLVAQSCDPQGRTYIDRSQRALARVQQLVEALLAFARSGARPDPSARCQVDAVVASVVADLSETAAEKGIALVIDRGDSVQVACSPGAFTSIVQNLVQNAIKYMGAQAVRRIVVRAKATGSIVRLEVQDTGPGIPADLQARIFDPFVRATEEEVSGTGLGLATVKRLVESHGGKVGVLSKPESGTLFFVELPRVQAESPDLPVGASIHASDSPRPGDHEADVRPDRSLAGPRAGG